MRIGIHLFHKDLRINDNLALNELSKHVDRVIGLFIFDRTQIKKTHKNAAFYSDFAAQFVVDSVNDLNQQCGGKLVIQYGDPVVVLVKIIKIVKPVAVSFNMDFTPYATMRDLDVSNRCSRLGIKVISNPDDQSLTKMQSMIKKDGEPYLVYGAFFKNLNTHSIERPTTKRIVWTAIRLPQYHNAKHLDIGLAGGRKEGLRRLKHNISTTSDKVGSPTSRLSAYMNQGCISVREVYWATNKKALSSIAWRDFFLCIYRFHKSGNNYHRFVHSEYDKIKWTRLRLAEWKHFIECKTGFILVDAIMTELLSTGFINNRSRLILATFWIKYLMINPFDPVYGSQVWFSRLLIDCSASQNKLNHQWVIGDLDVSGRRFALKGCNPLTGRHMQIDNDVVIKYDPQFEYIKKWIPSFADKSIKECKQLLKQIVPMYQWRERYQQYNKLFKGL